MWMKLIGSLKFGTTLFCLNGCTTVRPPLRDVSRESKKRRWINSCMTSFYNNGIRRFHMTNIITCMHRNLNTCFLTPIATDNVLFGVINWHSRRQRFIPHQHKKVMAATRGPSSACESQILLDRTSRDCGRLQICDATRRWNFCLMTKLTLMLTLRPHDV